MNLDLSSFDANLYDMEKAFFVFFFLSCQRLIVFCVGDRKVLMIELVLTVTVSLPCHLGCRKTRQHICINSYCMLRLTSSKMWFGTPITCMTSRVPLSVIEKKYTSDGIHLWKGQIKLLDTRFFCSLPLLMEYRAASPLCLFCN